MFVGDTAFHAAGHIPVGIIGVGVRRSRFGADTRDGVRDGRAVGEGPCEPACRVGGLRVVHAGVGQSSNVRESSGFKVVEIDCAAGRGIHALCAEADIGQRARVVVNESERLFLDIVQLG